MPSKITTTQLRNMKENLSMFRKITGFSPEEFGELIGLTRQSITNLETGKTPLTPLHFRAIHQLINEVYIEKVMSGDSPIIAIAMMLFLTDDEMEEEDYKEYKRIFAQLATLINDGVVDDPIATLKGLILSSFQLSAGDVVPDDRLLENLNEIISEAFKDMSDKIEKAFQ